jgi:EF hand domain-containing protein
MSSSIKLLSMSAILFATAPVFAQRTEDGRRGATANSVDSFVAKLMAFDKNHDGKLTKDEITDDRLLPLFERADADHDGVVTVEELKALYAAESETLVAQGPGGRDRGGPPDDGGPDGPGPGAPGGPGGRGPGGPGGFGAPPQPGQIMPARLQETLKLTDDQKKAIAELQKEVDAKLDKILTADQKKQLKEMRNRRGPGPGGPGGGRGPGGGPGGGGPGDPPPNGF